MNKRLFILLSLLFVLLVGVAASPPKLPYDSLRQLVAYLEGRNNTFSGSNTYTGTNTFTNTNTFSTLSTPDLRSGISPFVLTSDTVLTTAQLDGRVFTIPTSTAIKVQFPAAAKGLGCYLVDTTAIVGAAAGVSPWSNGSSMYAGTGTAAVYGTTVFANSGVTRTTTRVLAMPMSNGTWSWQVFSDIGTWLKLN